MQHRQPWAGHHGFTATPDGQASPCTAPHTAGLASEPGCCAACWCWHGARRCVGQDLGCPVPPCPAWMWSLTWPDPTAACRVTGRAGVSPCRGSCAHPAYGLLTLPCSSQPSREMSCARSTVSTAQPGWQPGPGAGGHVWLPSRPATMHGAPRHPLPALVPGRAQGASPCPLGTWHGEAGRGSQASCPARHCPMALPGTVVPSTPQLSHFFRDLGIAMPCPGWA